MLESINAQLVIILLLSVRVLVILSLTPVVSGQQSMFLVRIALSVLTVFSIQHLIPEGSIRVPETLGELLLVLVGEALIGVVIGFFIRLVFSLLGIFSEFFTTQMGLRAAQVVDPVSQTETVVIQQLASLLVLIVFLSSFTLQRVFYYGIAQSFQVMTWERIYQLGREPIVFLLGSFVTLFERSFLIALPIFASLFLVNVGLGLIGKVAPQMNVLILGIPIQIGVGFLLLVIFLPGIVHTLEIVFDWSFGQIGRFLRVGQP